MNATSVQPSSSVSQALSSLFVLARRTTIGILYLFLLAPVVVAAIISFDTQESLNFPPQGFTLRWYGEIFENTEFVRGFQTSFLLAMVVAFLATIIGVPAALALVRRQFRGRSSILTLFTMPLIVPSVVLGLALLLALSPLGLTGNYPGLVLAYVGLTLPFVVRTTMVSLMSQDLSCEEAARTLGANGWVAFRRVVLPLTAPGILAGAAIAFIIAFDEAVIALFIVGTDVTLLPVEIYKYVSYQTDPQIAALSVVLVAFSLILVVLIDRLIGLKRALR